MKTPVFALVFSFLFVGQIEAAGMHQHKGGHGVSPYAGEHHRTIKALSDQDIDDLENGRGWGFAKAAELNGVPGPAHLLEFKEQIGLSGAQTKKIEELFRQMNAKAIPLGKKLVELERKLDNFFEQKGESSKELKELLVDIGAVRTDLRFVHLETHLKTPKLLKPSQIRSYNILRGYKP